MNTHMGTFTSKYIFSTHYPILNPNTLALHQVVDPSLNFFIMFLNRDIIEAID